MLSRAMTLWGFFLLLPSLTLLLSFSLCWFPPTRERPCLKKKSLLSCGSLGEEKKGTWVFRGVGGCVFLWRWGRREVRFGGAGGGGLLMTEVVSFLWNLLPLWATVLLSVQRQALSSSVFMRGRDKIAGWNRQKGMAQRKKFKAVSKVRVFLN